MENYSHEMVTVMIWRGSIPDECLGVHYMHNGWIVQPVTLLCPLIPSLLAVPIYGHDFFLLRVPSCKTVFWIPSVSWLGPLSVLGCVNTVVFPCGPEQTSDHQSNSAAWASWQATSSPSTLGRGAIVVAAIDVCYVHKCHISSWTGVNLVVCRRRHAHSL